MEINFKGSETLQKITTITTTKQNRNQKDSDHGLLRIYHISEMILDLICSMQAKWKNAYDSSHNKILKSGEKSHFRSHHILKLY